MICLTTGLFIKTLNAALWNYTISPLKNLYKFFFNFQMMMWHNLKISLHQALMFFKFKNQTTAKVNLIIKFKNKNYIIISSFGSCFLLRVFVASPLNMKDLMQTLAYWGNSSCAGHKKHGSGSMTSHSPEGNHMPAHSPFSPTSNRLSVLTYCLYTYLQKQEWVSRLEALLRVLVIKVFYFPFLGNCRDAHIVISVALDTVVLCQSVFSSTSYNIHPGIAYAWSSGCFLFVGAVPFSTSLQLIIHPVTCLSLKVR